jgi:undecaprenyl-phosphate 4-deoxy-4-formamido-L-arabinose transferase
VTGINLAKNFGQHAALMAGLRASKGEYVICLDDDGQTPADEADKLVAAILAGADVAYARYSNKQHNAFRNFGTAMNEWMASVMLGKPKDLYVSSYFIARRFVVDEMLSYESSYPYVIGLVLRTTRNIVNVDVTHRRREVGQSGYTLGKLFALWINGFTAFSIKPLRIATMSGAIFAVLGIIYGIYTVVKKFVYPMAPMGFAALMSAVVFMGGMIMLMLGMIGEYVGRVYISQNKNPQYVIRETTKDDETD